MSSSPLYPMDNLHTMIETTVWERHSRMQLTFMVLSIFFWIFSAISAIGAILISRNRYSSTHKSSRSSRLAKEDAPGVTVIRPLRGIDCNMYENLASSFKQDYPKFEIIFSVAQPNDPAIAVVRDLMKKFPKVDARIIIGERDVGINPKINNMIQSYETAKYDTVWVCDSNVYVDPGCMGRSMDLMMTPGVGLVHHLPFGIRPQSLGSELELMFLDTVHAKMYLFINWTGLASCVVGKSNLYRRSDLDKVGGLAAFGKYMAEDNLVATAIFNMGYKHRMTSDLAYQSLGSMTTSDYFTRRARWTRIRKYTVTAATVVEPFIEMIGCGMFASYGFNLLFDTHWLNFLAFHVVVWFLADLSLYQALSSKKVDNLRGFLMAWSLRELAALPLYTYAVVGSTVDWRDQSFQLLRDGTVRVLSKDSGFSPLSPTSLSFGITLPNLSTLSLSSPTATTFSSARNLPLKTAPTDVSMSAFSAPSSPITDNSQSLFGQRLQRTRQWVWFKLGSPTLASAVPQSTQASLRKFFRRPMVISVVKNTFAVIHFVVDILLKSQRNGTVDGAQNESTDDEEEQENETVILKPMSSPKVMSKVQNRRDLKKLMLKRNQDDKELTSLRRSPRLSSSSGSTSPKSPRPEQEEEESNTGISRFSNTKSETEAEHGRRSTEEDALSEAMEPYLSNSMSRRGRVYHEIPAQFMARA